MHPLEKRILLPEDLKPLNSIEGYKARGGLQALAKARNTKPEELIELVKQSNLRGRGGAGFPTGIKWETVYKDPAPTKYVVCNMAEGEPGTYKDRYLISKNPYLLVEGLLITAYVINAKEAIIGTKGKYKEVVDRLESAIAEFEKEGVAEKGYMRVVSGPDDYLLGEEKALLEVIDGRGAMPRFYPPFQVGVNYSTWDTNPTIVNNAESMSHLPLIINNGVEWFKSSGSEDTPGTSIISLSGDVKKPGMYEISLGIPVKDLLYELGGGPREGRQFKAIFSGVANRVMTPDQFDLAMDFGTLRKNGVGLGSGGFIVYDDSRSMLQITWMLSHFLAASSCGQCIPCNMGTRVITEHLLKLKNAEGSQDDVDAIFAECGRCTNQTRCFLPTQESVLVSSVINKFPQEFQDFGGIPEKYDQNIPVPKLKYFDDEKGEFLYEEDPIEFRENMVLFS